MDDLWGDDSEGEVCSDHAIVATAKKVSADMYKAGFRDGKSMEEERKVQALFDQGLEKGLVSGMLCGSLMAEFMISRLEMGGKTPEQEQLAHNLSKVEDCLCRTVPGQLHVDNYPSADVTNEVNSLREVFSEEGVVPAGASIEDLLKPSPH